MTDIAIHIRIFEANPTDDFVEKRKNAIADLSTSFAKRKSVRDILQLANDLAAAISARRIESATLSGEVEAAIKSHSPSFVQEGQGLQMLVCALIAALSNLESATASSGPLQKTDALAIGLWSALSFQPICTEAKLENLRAELLSRSQTLISETSTSARKRVEVAEIAFKVPEPAELSTFADAITKGTTKTIKALRDNAALDREEIDLLWWVLSDWSCLLNAAFSSLPAGVAAIGRGLEAATILRRLPGEAHKHLVLRDVAMASPLSLEKLIQTLGDNRVKLATAFQGNGTIDTCPTVFPFLSSLLADQKSGIASKQERSLHDWAGRALLESAIINVALEPAQGL